MTNILGHIYIQDTSTPFLGRSVADKEFLVALFKYGTFDEYHFFFENDKLINQFKDEFQSIIIDNQKANNIKLINICDLDACLATYSYTVFHTTDPILDKLLHIRNTFTLREPFPITGYTHTLSSRFLIRGHLLTLMYKPGSYDSIICSSQCGKEVMKKIFSNINDNFQSAFGNNINYNGRFDHIPLGINTNEFNLLSKEEARQKFNLSKDLKIILSIGRLSISSKMDYLPLIDAFAETIKVEPNARLILAGGLPKDQEAYIQEIKIHANSLGITDQLIIYPNFDNDHKHILYSAADIFVSPSDNVQETFGITIIEALASGIPIVCSDWNGYKELVTEGITGFKIPTVCQKSNGYLQDMTNLTINPSFLLSQTTAIDTKKMSETFISLLKNKTKQEEMRNEALIEAKKYDWTNLIPQYEKLWKELKKIAVIEYKRSEYSLDFNYYDVFDHYPTRLLQAKDLLNITIKGIKTLKHEIQLSINNSLINYMDFNLIADILKKLSEKKLTIAELAASNPQINIDKIHRHILWLLKYSLIELEQWT